MKKLSILYLLVGAFQTIYAQDVTPILRNYKYRFQEYRSSNISLVSNFESSNFENRDTQGRYDFGNTGRNLSGSAQFAGLRYSNTESKIHYAAFNFYSDFVTSRGRKSTFETNRFNIYGSYNSSTQWYKTQDKKYVKFAYGAQGSTYNEAKVIMIGNERSTSEVALNQGNISGSIGAGLGRVENISDPAFAAFWLKDLFQKGIIKNYTDDDIVAIAKALTKTRNTRIMDFRFRMIDQIQMLDSAFQNSGLLLDKWAAYYTTLYDHYLYANNYSRYHGSNTELGFNLQPNYISDYYFFRDNDSSLHISTYRIQTSVTPTIYFKHVNHFAQNLHSQWSYGGEMFLGLEMGRLKKRNFNAITPKESIVGGVSMNANAYVEHNIYVDSRNYFTNKVVAGVVTNWYKDLIGKYTYFGYTLDYYHWFSSHLQINANAGFNMYKNAFDYSKPEAKSYQLSYYPRGQVRLNYVFY